MWIKPTLIVLIVLIVLVSVVASVVAVITPSSLPASNKSCSSSSNNMTSTSTSMREGFETDDDDALHMPKFCVGDFCADEVMVRDGLRSYAKTVGNMKSRAKSVTKKLDANIQRRDQILGVIRAINRERESNTAELRKRIDDALENRRSMQRTFAEDMTSLEQRRREGSETVDELIADRTWMS